jgi:hypothetical protein
VLYDWLFEVRLGRDVVRALSLWPVEVDSLAGLAEATSGTELALAGGKFNI